MTTTITNQFTTQPFVPKTWEKTEDGFLRVKARVLAERVMPYHPDELTNLPEELKTLPCINMLVDCTTMGSGESLRTLEAAQVTAPDHIWVTPENDHVSRGNTAGAPRMDGPFLETDLLITDPDTIADIEEGRIGEISAGYHADTIFEPGEFDGQPYQARQTQLRFNHIAVIPYGTGRAGSDVRIINQKKQKETTMSEPKMVRVRLRNTGRYVNVDEESASAIEAEGEASEGSGKKLEETMAELDGKTQEASALQAEIDELKGELSVYKEKLDQLLSTEAIEHAAEEMVQESGEAEEIIENAFGESEEDKKKKEEVMNSLKGLHGTKLHTHVLNSIGVQTEGMNADAMRGAFKAQHQVRTKIGNRKVAGTKVTNATIPASTAVAQPVVRSARQRLGLSDK